MKRAPILLYSALLLALSACAAGGTQPASGPAPDAEMSAPEATSAVVTDASAAPAAGGTSFSDAQADRGRDVFRATCTECHYSSEFSDSQFKFKWSRRSAGNLFQLIQTSMPETAPGSLTAEETVDIVSYILRMNGFEPGAEELAADRAVLDGLSLASIRNR